MGPLFCNGAAQHMQSTKTKSLPLENEIRRIYIYILFYFFKKEIISKRFVLQRTIFFFNFIYYVGSARRKFELTRRIVGSGVFAVMQRFNSNPSFMGSKNDGPGHVGLSRVWNQCDAIFFFPLLRAHLTTVCSNIHLTHLTIHGSYFDGFDEKWDPHCSQPRILSGKRNIIIKH